MDCVRANISVTCRKQTVGGTNSDAAVGTKEEGDHLRGVDHMAKGKKRDGNSCGEEYCFGFWRAFG